MTKWIADRDAWGNTRLVCWECNETTWKQGERMHARLSSGVAMYNTVRWWTCEECFQ